MTDGNTTTIGPVTEVNVNVDVPHLRNMTEDQMRGLAGQFVDMFVDHSRLAKQVAQLTQEFHDARTNWQAQSVELHKQIEDLRQSLVQANAERDQLRTERDHVQANLQTAWRTIDDLNGQVSGLKDELVVERQGHAETRQSLDTTKRESDDWQGKFNHSQSELSQRTQWHEQTVHALTEERSAHADTVAKLSIERQDRANDVARLTRELAEANQKIEAARNALSNVIMATQAVA